MERSEWKYATGGVVGSSPAIASDGTIYVGSHDHKLYALKSDGSLKWDYLTDGVVNEPRQLLGPMELFMLVQTVENCTP